MLNSDYSFNSINPSNKSNIPDEENFSENQKGGQIDDPSLNEVNRFIEIADRLKGGGSIDISTLESMTQLLKNSDPIEGGATSPLGALISNRPPVSPGGSIPLESPNKSEEEIDMAISRLEQQREVMIRLVESKVEAIIKKIEMNPLLSSEQKNEYIAKVEDAKDSQIDKINLVFDAAINTLESKQ